MRAPRATSSALALSSEAEKAGILDELVVADHELEGRAERTACWRLAAVDTHTKMAQNGLVRWDASRKAGRARCQGEGSSWTGQTPTAETWQAVR